MACSSACRWPAAWRSSRTCSWPAIEGHDVKDEEVSVQRQPSEDEPFSALDEISARKLRQEFVRIWAATGRTILFVTHNIREAVFLSTRMLVISARPAQMFLDLPLDVPHPRAPEDDALFEIEKRVTRDFMRMEEEAS